MQEKNTNNPGEKKQGEYPETGKQTARDLAKVLK